MSFFSSLGGWGGALGRAERGLDGQEKWSIGFLGARDGMKSYQSRAPGQYFYPGLSFTDSR